MMKNACKGFDKNDEKYNDGDDEEEKNCTKE